MIDIAQTAHAAAGFFGEFHTPAGDGREGTSFAPDMPAICVVSSQISCSERRMDK